MEPAPANRTAPSGLVVLVQFTLSTVVLSLVMAAIAHPFVHLGLWKVFRRCVSISAAMSLLVITTRVERRSIRSYGLLASEVGLRQLRVGVLVGLLSLAGMFAFSFAARLCHIELEADRLRLWRTLIGFVPLAFVIGLLEELVFRGLILQQLLRYSRWLGVVGSSVAYALVHLRTPTMNLLTGLELGGLFLLGVVLSFSYLKTQQLFMAIGLHASLAYGVRTNKLLITFPDAATWWLTGTNRLVNGLIGWLVLLVIAWIVYRYGEQRVSKPQGGAG